MATPGSTISVTVADGNTGAVATLFYITAINMQYSQGVFVSGSIFLAGYIAPADTDPIITDSIKAVSGPKPNQDIMAWAVAAVLQDAKYAGGTAS